MRSHKPRHPLFNLLCLSFLHLRYHALEDEQYDSVYYLRSGIQMCKAVEER